MKVSTPVKKGQVLCRPSPWIIVPLFGSQLEPFTSEANMLPNYDAMVHPDDLILRFQEDKALTKFVLRLLKTPGIAAYGLAVTMRIAVDERKISNDKRASDDLHERESKVIRETDIWNNDEERENAYEGWTLVQQFADWYRFMDIYVHVRKHVHITSFPHPLTQYVTRVLPELEPSEQEAALRLLYGTVNKRRENISTIGVIQAVLDTYEQRPRMFAVLLYPPGVSEESTKILHSCLPNAAWKMNTESGEVTVELVALYDLQEEEAVSVTTVDNSLSYDGRVDDLIERFGRGKNGKPCECCRCNYESCGKTPHNRDAQRLGHLGVHQGRYEDAQRLYCLALEQDFNLPDIWHALGAVLLHQQRFLEAQKYWKDAAEKHDFLKHHEGIALQLEKQSAYRYFDWRKETSASFWFPDITSYFQGLCFVTKDPLISCGDCTRVISWAEEASGGWTTSRHYAVPTTDVPVHKVDPLLEWFMDCMESTIYPLMSSHFCRPDDKRWYVHDAFVVRYDAFRKNNHLPLHCDESTHSFVLALNDGFEGGGTYFEGWDQTLSASRGHLICFRGDSLRHGGNVVTKGVRYILAAFLYLDDLQESHTTAQLKLTRKRLNLHQVFQAKRKREEGAEESSFSFGFDVSTTR